MLVIEKNSIAHTHTSHTHVTHTHTPTHQRALARAATATGWGLLAQDERACCAALWLVFGLRLQHVRVAEDAGHQALDALLNVFIVLGGRLKPAHKAMLLAEGIQLVLVDGRVGQVALVGQQHNRQRLAIGQRHFAVNLALPLQTHKKGGGVGAV
jgi:hypothetical protein